MMQQPRWCSCAVGGLRRLLWAPSELGLVRAYVSGDMQIEGDIFALLDLPDVIERVAHHQGIGLSSRQRLSAAVSAVRILSLIHISEPTRRTPISYAVF